jgi:hypothetical protein
LVVRTPKRLTNLYKLCCPYCSNDNLLLIVNFTEKWEGKSNVAFCIKKVTKNVWGMSNIVGCGRKINLEILPRNRLKFPPL